MILTGDFSFPSGGAATARIRNVAQAFDALGGTALVLPLANLSTNRVDWTAGLYRSDGSLASKPAQAGILASAWPANRTLLAKLRWLFESYSGSWRLARHFRGDPVRRDGEVMYLYGRSYLRLRPWIRAAREKKMKIALDVVEGIERFHGTGGILNPVYWDWWLGTRMLPRLVDRTYAISTGLAERCAGFRAGEVRLLPSIEAWPSTPPAPKQVGPALQLLYVGGLTAKEAPEVLAAVSEAVGRSNGWIQLSIVGRYQDSAEGRENARRIQRACAGKGVFLRGSVSDSEMAALKEAADGFLLLRADTVAERLAFPTRLVEFLRMGRPVWTSNIGDVGHYLEDGKSAFLLSSNPAEAVAKLWATLAESSRHLAVGRAGFFAGKANFDRAHHVRSLWEWESLHHR